MLILATSSCSSNDDLLKELSVNCMCEITSYWELSTDKQASNTREVSFKNSKLFDFEVTKESFVRSSAILLSKRFENNSFTMIKLNLIDGDESDQHVDSYTFTRVEIEKNYSKYFESEQIINEFIGAIYDKNLIKNYGLLDVEMSSEEYEPIFDNLNEGLEKDYVETRIVGFNIRDSTYRIDAGIYLESGNLLLFSLRLKEIEDNLKITGFDF